MNGAVICLKRRGILSLITAKFAKNVVMKSKGTNILSLVIVVNVVDAITQKIQAYYKKNYSKLELFKVQVSMLYNIRVIIYFMAIIV